MADSGNGLPDWRDPSAYAPLLAADRSAFAWEWLRREEAYQSAARAGASSSNAAPEAEAWCLHAFADPCLAAADARPVWRRQDHPYVLEARAEPSAHSCDCFDLDTVQPLATLLRSSRGPEHLLLSDGFHAVRLDILGGSVSKGPVELHYRLSGLRAAESPVLVLRQFLGLILSGRFQAQLFPRDVRAARRILLLRTRDALQAGAEQREIAEVLLSREAGAARWRVAVPSLRSRAQRLVRAARRMAGGGYRELLRREPRRTRLL